MTLTYGSLFAGIGGMDLGLDRAGMECRWQVEIDPYCRNVLTKHWPDVPKYEDVREVGAHNLEPVDVVAGGFPCQDISLAGKGAGLDGERSGLWWEFHRIIRELGPRYVIVENVRALTVRGLDAVLGSLADIGYDAEWQMLSAESVGAPHRRDRIFIVAYAKGVGHGEWRESRNIREAHGGQDNGLRPKPPGASPQTGIIAYANGDGGHERRAESARQSRETWATDGGDDVAHAASWKGDGRGRGVVAQEAGARGCIDAATVAGGQDVAHPQGQPERTGLRDDEPGRERLGRSGDGGGEGTIRNANSDGESTMPVDDEASRVSGDGADADIKRTQVPDRREHATEPESGSDGRPRGLDEFRSTVGAAQWAVEPDVGRVAHGIPSRVDRLRGLGNAVVPQVAEFVGRCIVEADKCT